MEKIFLSVLNMSLTSSFIIAAIMLVRLPLKKAPKIISYALWAVAGFRLVFPFTLESVFSLLPFKAAPIPQNIAIQAIPRIDSGITIIDNAVSASLPAANPVASVNPLQVLIFIGSCVWILGIVVMLVYSLVSIVLLKRRLRGAILVESNLYEANNLKTPFVIGLFKPKIYIPAGLTDEEHNYIVLHERTHIRRGDHIIKMFAYFILCLHWFNPFAWVAFILMGADMEMSCDERVMRELGGNIKNAYSLLLVRMATGHKILNGSPLAFSEGGMKERVKNVLNFKKPSRVIIALAVVLVAVLSMGFAVNKVSGSGNAQQAVLCSHYVDENSVLLGDVELGSYKVFFYENDDKYRTIITKKSYSSWRLNQNSFWANKTQDTVKMVGWCSFADNEAGKGITAIPIQCFDKNVAYIEMGSGDDRVKREVIYGELVVFAWEYSMGWNDLNAIAYSNNNEPLYILGYEKTGAMIKTDELRWLPVDK